MCNLYRHDLSLDTLKRFSASIELPFLLPDELGNLPGAYVGRDQDGPVLHKAQDGLKLSMARWGFPPVADGKDLITNIRNLDSSWWRNVNRDWMQNPEHRCLVPFTRFAEWSKADKGNAWFDVPDAPIAYFAGVSRPWHGERLKAVEGKKRRQREADDWTLFAFLTTSPNELVGPIHPKAMPVILTVPSECARWLSGGAETFALQRPYPASSMRRVQD